MQQDDNQPTQYNTQQPNNPYDDQQTFPASPPPPPYGQVTRSFTSGSEDPTIAVPPLQNSMPATGNIPQAGTMSATTPPQKAANKKTLLIGGAIILVLFILGIGGAFAFSKLTANANNQATTAVPGITSTPGAANAAARNVYTQYLVQYRDTIRSQIAQNLHLSPDQLETQLSAGKTLSSIATTQGVSNAQLQVIVTNAFQTSLLPVITNGNLTQKQVTALAKRMLKQPKTLDRLLMAPAKKVPGTNASATPAA
jgi:hypothetical protein